MRIIIKGVLARTVSVSKRILEDGRAGFSVSDTGVGMTAADIAVARERFGRVGDVLTRREDGVGLGLPVAIELMACHDGALLIDSRKGIGTTVTALFPKARVSLEAEPAPAGKPALGQAALVRGSAMSGAD